MGEPLYDEVVGPLAQGKLNRPCRIYAPVGTHETLLAYLVRRLLENGANTSFVNLIGDESIPVEQLVSDPVDAASRVVPLGAPHEKIPLPRELFGNPQEGARANSAGLDLSNEHRLGSLSAALLASAGMTWRAGPMLGEGAQAWDAARAVEVRNPANLRDLVGHVVEANAEEAEAALRIAANAAPIWQSTPVAERAQCLRRAAQLLEEQMQTLLGLIVREAGKSLPNAIAEVREAVDFLRYYADQASREFGNDTHRPLGTVLCISPWNFPLAIFTGQVAAALAAGNTVLAKPAEQTPLIAAQAIEILRAAGVPAGAVQLLPGRGETVGAQLVASPGVRGVMFTGSTDVARIIARALADRLDDDGHTIPLIAETGGQNAMVVDSSALAEQVVFDVLSSAFDSAGQRCSAARAVHPGRQRRPRADDAARRHARTQRGQSRSPVGRRGAGDRRRGPQWHRAPHRRHAHRRPSRGPARTQWRMPPRHFRAADHYRDRPYQRTEARDLRSGAACGALQARGTGCAAGGRERHRLRPDLRRAYPHR